MITAMIDGMLNTNAVAMNAAEVEMPITAPARAARTSSACS
jgi:hypothetical protein